MNNPGVVVSLIPFIGTARRASSSHGAADDEGDENENHLGGENDRPDHPAESAAERAS